MTPGPSLRLAQTLLGAGAVCPACKKPIRRFQARIKHRGAYHHRHCVAYRRRGV